jgi:hypothetical protein
LAGSSASELAALSESELGVSAASSMNKFRKAVEQIKVALVPIGELFVEIATPFVEFGTRMLDAFNNLPEGIKKSIGGVITIIGGLGPIALMTFGLINNGIANMIKFFATVRLGYLKITGQAKGVGDETQYMTQEQLEAAAAAASLDQAHSGLIQRFTAEKVVVDKLRDAYTQAAAAGARFAAINPGMMLPGKAPQKFAQGGFVSGSGNGDTVPAMLTPGEFVIKKKEAQVFLPLLQAINEGKVPGFANGGLVGKGFSNATMFLPESLNTLAGGSGAGAAMGDVTAYLKQAGSAAAAPIMAVMAREMGLKLNDPSLFKEWETLGSTLVQNATNALEQSGKQFVTDDDFEEIVVPAMKKSAESISVSGKEVKKALENAFEQIRTVAPLGAKSGAAGGQGRVSLPGSYRGARAPAQKFALASNPEMFQQSERFSQSRSRIVKSFQTKNVATGEFEVATMSHLKRSITAKVDELILKVAPYLGDQSARIVKAVSKSTVEGIKESTQQASPSKEAHNAGKNIGVGAINGIKETTDDARMAGEELGQAATSGVKKGPRRASTNPEVMAALAGTSQAQINTEPRRASSPAGRTQNGVFVPVQQQVEQPQKATLSMEGFVDKASKATFALSAVSGILTMFGGEMSAVTGVVMGISSAMFALIQITSLLSSTKLGEIAASRAAKVAEGIGGGFGAAGSLLGTGGFLSKIANGFKFVLRFLGPIGIGLSALAIALPFITKLYQDQKNKMEAFGNIVDVTADQIKFLGQQASETPITETGFDLAAASEQEEVSTSAAKQRAEDEEFRSKFEKQISAAKSGARESVEDALNLLAFKLSSSGLSDTVVQETIAAIVRASQRTDIKFDFKSIGISEENTQGLINSFKDRAEGLSLFDWNSQSGKELSVLMESFALQLEGGKIDIDQYVQKMLELRDAVNLIQSEDLRSGVINTAIDELISDEALQKQIKGIEDLDKRFLLLQAAGAATGPVLAQLTKEAEDSSISTADFAKSIKIKTAAQRADNAVAEEAAEIETATTAAVTNIKNETNAINDKIKAYEILREAGYSTEEALSLLNDEVLIGQLVTEGGAAGVKDVVDDLLEARSKMDAISGSGRGGSGSNPIQDAIEGLKKQRQEVLNTSRAYGELRKSGMSAAKAFEFAQNPELLSAMNSGLKAGTKQWDEIIKRIQAAEKATRRWQNATVQGQTEQFMEVYSKVDELFSAEEALLQAAFDATTKADKQLIESLEEKISGFNRQIEDYSRDLDDIAQKENDINEAYDKKVKALEQTKKINDDILRQQKSQLSIADALSQGNVAAAASAMQQARSENAAAALEAQGNQLQLGREAQIAGLRTPGGLSREQIEEKIKNLKKEISVIETGSLRLAQDRVKAAQDELDKNVEALRIGGLSKTQWEAQAAAIDVAKARANIYDGELKKALKNVEKIVTGWESLNTTIKTTHEITTVNVGSGGGGGGGVLDSDKQKKTVVQSGQFTKAQIEAKERAAAAAASKVINPGMSKPTVAQLNFARQSQKKASGGKVGYYPMGGLIPYMANGGMFQSVNTDTVPAMLTPGEFVVKRSSVDRFGLQNLKNINNGTYGNTLSRGFNQPVYPEISRDYASANIGGGIYSSSDVPQSNTQVDNSVYNYSLSVNVEGTDASPDQIANVVMRKLQDFGSQRVRGQVVR